MLTLHLLNILEIRSNSILYLDLDVFYQFVQYFQELIISNWNVYGDKYSMAMVRKWATKTAFVLNSPSLSTQSVQTCWIQEFIHDVNDSICCHDVSFFGLQLVHQKCLIYL